MNTKKVLVKKLYYQFKMGAWVLKQSVFWAKLFLSVLFSKVMCTFLKSVRKDGFFDNPFDLIKEKKLLSHSRVSVYFHELKSGSNHSIFRKTVFYKQVLKFQYPSKFLCQTSVRQNNWSSLHRYLPA